MQEPFGLIRLEAVAAPDVWHARTPLTLYAVEPRSIVTVALSVAALKDGDVAGLALFGTPHAWLGVERARDGFTLARFDQQSGTRRVRLGKGRVWLRAECDFVRDRAGFHYSTDGGGYAGTGGECPIGARAIVCALFCCTTLEQAAGGCAVFDSFVVTTDPRQQGARR